MGFENNPQFTSKDGCIYVFVLDKQKWFKFCPAEVLPHDVKKQINDIKEKAEQLKDS